MSDSQNQNPEAVRPAILFVDDEVGLTSLAKLALSGRFDVQVSASASEALALGDNPNIRLLLSDFHMDEMNGVELIRLIRAKRPDLPCILFSGNLTRDSWAAAHNAGCRHVLSKPLALNIIIDLCTKLLAPPEEVAVSAQGLDFVESVPWQGKLGKNLRTLVEHLRAGGGPIFLHTPGSVFPPELLHGLLPTLQVYPSANTPPPPQPLFTDLERLDIAGQTRLAQLFLSRRDFPWLLAADGTPDELLEQGRLAETVYFRLGSSVVTLPAPADHPGDSVHLCGWWLSTLSPAIGLSDEARLWLIDQIGSWDWPTLLDFLRDAVSQCTDEVVGLHQVQHAALALSLGSDLSDLQRYPDFAGDHERQLRAAWDLLARDSAV